MMSLNIYHPILFFSVTMIGTFLFWFFGAHFSHQEGKQKSLLFLILAGALVPLTAALSLIYSSHSIALIQDFWHRVILFQINLSSIFMLLVITGCFFLATIISLFFGKSTNQFSLGGEIDAMKGWRIWSLLIPIFVAPMIEELGWRGYGVDSLASHFNLFYTSLIFGILWSIWHAPLAFIKGYYPHQLRSLGAIYVFNYFASIIPIAFLMNWLYFNNSRSIPIAIFAHGIINGPSVLFKADQLTKCIFTILLYIITILLVFVEKDVFFRM